MEGSTNVAGHKIDEGLQVLHLSWYSGLTVAFIMT